MLTADLLSRNHFVSVVSNIVDSKIQQKEGYSFAIDGEWGCGKTTVLDILEERLKNRYLVIRYNCWKYDFYEEPLIALLSEFAKAINSEQAFDFEEYEKRVWGVAGKMCSGVVSKLIQSETGLDIRTAVKHVNSIRSNVKQKRIKIKDVKQVKACRGIVDSATYPTAFLCNAAPYYSLAILTLACMPPSIVAA